MKRFFFHYYKQYKCLSVHFNGQCHKVKDVDCKVPCESKWSKRQPNLVMRGFCNDVQIKNGIAIIV
jgi:hypothetical protein